MNDEAQRVPDTLFYPVESGIIPPPTRGGRTAFFNAMFHPALELFSNGELFLQQYFRPYAQRLESSGYTVCNDTGSELSGLDLALLALPKSRIEAEYMIAVALRALKRGGVLVAAADNKGGGARLEKMFSSFGLQDMRADSRNKCRVVVGCRGQDDKAAVDAALKAGGPVPVLDGMFHSWPGIFGWNKIDRGSEILLQNLPLDDLKGRGADFGCGYGYLSNFLAQQRPVTEILCIDADFRALQMCKKNIDGRNSGLKASFLWEDLRRPVPYCANLDFVIMNPPFHEGKAADTAIGVDFIRTAHASLRRGGSLYMVANRQLAYERVLEDLFEKCSKIFEGQGFKVFNARKA